MGLLLSVDDQRNAAYKTLAEVWRRQEGIDGKVLIEFHTLDKIETEAKMRTVIEGARRKGCNCVMFVVDQEPHDSSKRVLLERIRQAFDAVCRNLPDGVTVGLIVAHSCLECWLMADVQAIVRFQARGRGIRYAPTQSGRTDLCFPREANEKITHIMRQVGRAYGAPDLKRIKYEKSKSGEIARQMQNLAEAAGRNESLEYFFQMVECNQDGCQHRQPRPE